MQVKAVNERDGNVKSFEYRTPLCQPIMTLILIALNLLGFALESAGDRETVMRFALWPPHAGGAAGFHLWQLVTYSFLHASATHLAFNMWGLYMFGRPIERALGARRMGELYVASVVTGALAQTAVALLSAAGAYPSVGASAGVFGVLLAYALLFPKEPVVLLFPPIPMPAWLFATGYALLELALGLTGRAPGIAHFAHLGGMAAALALVLHWTRRAQHGQLD